MTTDEELAKLERGALLVGTHVLVPHFFSHFGSSRDERSGFQAALRKDGFGTPGEFTEIGADEEITGDGYWHHWAFTVFEADPLVLLGAEERAKRIAGSHGVRYDGSMVQRDLAGRVRPVG